MIVNTDSLVTLSTWAATRKRTNRKGETVIGCVRTYAYRLFDPENKDRAAMQVREEFCLVEIDGVKFVCPIADLPKTQNT